MLFETYGGLRIYHIGINLDCGFLSCDKGSV